VPRKPAARAAISIGLVTSALLLAACGGKGSSSSASSPAVTPSSSTPPASASGSPSPTPTIKASSNLDAIKVSGPYGKTPKVTVKTPWGIAQTRTKVIKASTGPAASAGGSVQVNYYGLNGRTGKVFDSSFSRGQPAAFPLGQVVPGFRKGLTGQHEGSRVLVAIPGKDGYDSQGGSPQAGIAVGDTLIFVVDLLQVQRPGPSGTAIPPKAGLPTVTDRKGTPVVTVPKTSPPTSLQVQPLIKGTGKKVGASDTITFHYVWLTWNDGKVVESDYGKGASTTDLPGLLPGLRKALTGQTVGSRVLVVVPPGQGYPNGNATPSISPGQTLVFVVDLLFSAAQ
jgi:peptidylprolyl isomerase